MDSLFEACRPRCSGVHARGSTPVRTGPSRQAKAHFNPSSPVSHSHLPGIADSFCFWSVSLRIKRRVGAGCSFRRATSLVVFKRALPPADDRAISRSQVPSSACWPGRRSAQHRGAHRWHGARDRQSSHFEVSPRLLWPCRLAGGARRPTSKCGADQEVPSGLLRRSARAPLDPGRWSGI